MTYTVPINKSIRLTAGSVLNSDVVTNYSYQWRYNGANIDGATSNIYFIQNTSSASMGFYDVAITNNANGKSSFGNSILLLVSNAVPLITLQPKGGDYKLGSYISLSAGAIGVGELTYKWYKNDIEISNENSSVLNIQNFKTSDIANYKFSATNNNGTTYSNNVSVNALSPPIINSFTTTNSQPLLNSLVTLTISVTNATSLIWRKNGIIIQTGNSSTFSIQKFTYDNNGIYDVEALNENGAVFSNSITIQANSYPIIQDVDAKNLFIVEGQDLNINPTVTNGSTFIWYFKKEVSSPYSPLQQTTSSLTIKSTNTDLNEGYYKLRATNLVGYVEKEFSVKIEKILKLQNPYLDISKSLNESFSQNVSFSIAVSSINWFFSTNGQDFKNTTKTGDTFTLPSISQNDAGYYAVTAVSQSQKQTLSLEKVFQIKIIEKEPEFKIEPQTPVRFLPNNSKTLNYTIDVGANSEMIITFGGNELKKYSFTSSKNWTATNTNANNFLNTIELKEKDNYLDLVINTKQLTKNDHSNKSLIITLNNKQTEKSPISSQINFEAISTSITSIYTLYVNGISNKTNIYENDDIKFEAIASTDKDLILQYEFFKDNNLIQGPSYNNIYTISNISTNNAGKYKVIVSNQYETNFYEWDISVDSGYKWLIYTSGTKINGQNTLELIPGSKISISGLITNLNQSKIYSIDFAYGKDIDTFNLNLNSKTTLPQPYIGSVLPFQGFNYWTTYSLGQINYSTGSLVERTNANLTDQGYYAVIAYEQNASTNNYERVITSDNFLLKIKTLNPKFVNFSDKYIEKYWGESLILSGQIEALSLASATTGFHWMFSKKDSYLEINDNNYLSNITHANNNISSNPKSSSLNQYNNIVLDYDFTLNSISDINQGYYIASGNLIYSKVSYSTLSHQITEQNLNRFYTFLCVKPDAYIVPNQKTNYNGIESNTLSITFTGYGSGIERVWVKSGTNNALYKSLTSNTFTTGLKLDSAGDYEFQLHQNNICKTGQFFTINLTNLITINEESINSIVNTSAEYTTGLDVNSEFKISFKTNYDNELSASNVRFQKSGAGNIWNDLTNDSDESVNSYKINVSKNDTGKYRFIVQNPKVDTNYKTGKIYNLSSVVVPLDILSTFSIFSGTPSLNKELQRSSERYLINSNIGNFLLSGISIGDPSISYQWYTGNPLSIANGCTSIIYTGNTKTRPTTWYALSGSQTIGSKINRDIQSNYIEIIGFPTLTGLHFLKQNPTYANTYQNFLIKNDPIYLNNKLNIDVYDNLEAGTGRSYIISGKIDGSVDQFQWCKSGEILLDSIIQNQNPKYDTIITGSKTSTLCLINPKQTNSGVYFLTLKNNSLNLEITGSAVNLKISNINPQIMYTGLVLQNNTNTVLGSANIAEIGNKTSISASAGTDLMISISGTGSGDELYNISWQRGESTSSPYLKTDTNYNIVNTQISANKTNGLEKSGNFLIKNLSDSLTGIYRVSLTSDANSTSSNKIFEINVFKAPTILTNTSFNRISSQPTATTLKLDGKDYYSVNFQNLSGYIPEFGTGIISISVDADDNGYEAFLKTGNSINNLIKDLTLNKFEVSTLKKANSSIKDINFVFKNVSLTSTGTYYPVIKNNYGELTGNKFILNFIDYPQVSCFVLKTGTLTSNLVEIVNATYQDLTSEYKMRDGFFGSRMCFVSCVTQPIPTGAVPISVWHNLMFSGTGSQEVVLSRKTGNILNNYSSTTFNYPSTYFSINGSGYYRMMYSGSGINNPSLGSQFDSVYSCCFRLGEFHDLNSLFRVPNAIDCYRSTGISAGNYLWENATNLANSCLTGKTGIGICFSVPYVQSYYPNYRMDFIWSFSANDKTLANPFANPIILKSGSDLGSATSSSKDFSYSGSGKLGMHPNDVGVYTLTVNQFSELLPKDGVNFKLTDSLKLAEVCVDLITEPKPFSYTGSDPYKIQNSVNLITGFEGQTNSFYFAATDFHNTSFLDIKVFSGKGTSKTEFINNTTNFSIEKQTQSEYNIYQQQNPNIWNPKYAKITYSNISLVDSEIEFLPQFSSSKGIVIQGTPIKLIITGQSKIIQHALPQSTTVYEKEKRTYSILAGGTPILTYQWYKSGTPPTALSNSTLINGATTKDLTICFNTTVNSGVYYPTVRNTISSKTYITTGSGVSISVLPQGPKFIYNSSSFETGTVWKTVGSIFKMGGSGSGFPNFKYESYKNQVLYPLAGTSQAETNSSGFGWTKTVERLDTACWELTIKNQNFLSNPQVDATACYRTGMCLKVVDSILIDTKNSIYNYYFPEDINSNLIITTSIDQVNSPSVEWFWFKNINNIYTKISPNASSSTTGFFNVSGKAYTSNDFTIKIPNTNQNFYTGKYKISGSGVYANPSQTVFRFEKEITIEKSIGSSIAPIWAGGTSASLIWFVNSPLALAGKTLKAGSYNFYLWGGGGGASSFNTTNVNAGAGGGAITGSFTINEDRIFELFVGKGGKSVSSNETRQAAVSNNNLNAGQGGPTIADSTRSYTNPVANTITVTSLSTNAAIISTKDSTKKMSGGGGGTHSSFTIYKNASAAFDQCLVAGGGGGAGGASTQTILTNQTWFIPAGGSKTTSSSTLGRGGGRRSTSSKQFTGILFHGGDSQGLTQANFYNGGGGASTFLNDYAGDGGEGGLTNVISSTTTPLTILATELTGGNASRSTNGIITAGVAAQNNSTIYNNYLKSNLVGEGSSDGLKDGGPGGFVIIKVS